MNKLTEDYVVGERVEYILPRAPKYGRHDTVYLPATIVNVTEKRIVITLDQQSKRKRVVAAWHIRRMAS